MSKVATCLAFTVGAAIGSAVTWVIAKKAYEKLAQEEIDSVKEVFTKRYSEKKDTDAPNTTEEEVKEDIPADPEVEEYKTQVEEYGYSNRKEEPQYEPYVIAPEEFGEKPGYDEQSLTYYADQVLTDDDDNLIRNVDAVVGIESLTHFGEYEDDSVFVRNDRLKCDYEILLDQRRYADVIAKKPYKAEV